MRVINIKGISSLITAVLLVLIVVSASLVVFRWGMQTTKNYQNKTESQVQQNIKKGDANFYIKEKNGRNLTIVNNGRIKLPVKAFTFYLNGRKMKAVPYKNIDTLAPGQEMKFNMTSI